MSSIGPNIGPNPKKLEVTHAAGVGVIENDRYTHHVALGAGVTEGMATDGKRLFVADIASGYVHVYDLSPSLLQTIVIPPPADFPFVRPDVPGEVHSGPRALAVKDDTLYVLNRFTGAIAEIDLKSLSLRKQTAVAPMLAQKERRLGQILYYADIGRSGMSCDSCHPEGHMDGVFFEKTKPLRIYRSTTVRGSMQTPPYFIPTSTHSLHETNALVGNRNRFQRKKLSHQELAALTLFSAQVTTLPNPFVDPDGAPVESLTLPDGETGHPRRGLTIFERGCQKCHPAPLFTLDQDPATRDQHFDVGTDKVFPLDTQWQDASTTRFPPPSLVGVWDEFPLFTAATAGLVTNDKGQLVVGTRFPLRNKHLGTLSREDENDLLAYLLSL